MEQLSVDNLLREDARQLIIKLPRNRTYLVHILKDGRRVFIRTDGGKPSYKDGQNIGNYNIRIFYEDSERQQKGLSYIEDVLVDMIRKRDYIGDEGIRTLLKAIKDSIELKPLHEIYANYPELKSFEERGIPGHSIELILVLLKWAGVEEDVNYWGINPNTRQPYEGRYKPYNALVDYFIRGERLHNVIKKHRLVS
jgi:hypothetical protein